MVNAISKYRGISFPRSISNVGSQHVPNIIRRQTPLKLIYYFYISSGNQGHLQRQKLTTFLLIVTDHLAECIHLYEFV